MKRKLLITGFDAFGKGSINPSWEAVKLLPDEVGDFVLCKLEIPTVFSLAAEKVLEKAEEIQNLIGTCGFTENGLPYPLTAKYHMCLEGLTTTLTARNRKDSEMTDYVKDCVSQMRALCKTYTDKL